jgi:hypothetical protein
MGPLDLLFHLLSFAAPAAAVAVMVAAASRWVLPTSGQGLAWWAEAAINCVAGLGVLAAGLWWWGADGKMATYAALVAVIATCQWFMTRGRRRA